MIVPVFPLTGTYLFPGALMPLHIFEPRYVQMVEDLLDTAGRLVVASMAEGESDRATPEFSAVGGLGEINGHKRLPDGRYLIVLVGLGRFALDEVPSDRLYRRVDAAPLEEIPVPESHATDLKSRLVDAVTERSSDRIDGVDDMATDRLADVLLMLLHQQAAVDATAMERLFAEADLGTRVSGVLEAHEVS